MKTANIVIKESGINVKLTGVWTRPDFEAAKYALLKELQASAARQRLGKETSDDGSE